MIVFIYALPPPLRYRYAHFLFSVCAFEAGVVHLWENGKKLEALHFAITLHFHGAISIDVFNDTGRHPIPPL